jgi:hypothetical protein
VPRLRGSSNCGAADFELTAAHPTLPVMQGPGPGMEDAGAAAAQSGQGRPKRSFLKRGTGVSARIFGTQIAKSRQQEVEIAAEALESSWSGTHHNNKAADTARPQDQAALLPSRSYTARWQSSSGHAAAVAAERQSTQGELCLWAACR